MRPCSQQTTSFSPSQNFAPVGACVSLSPSSTNCSAITFICILLRPPFEVADKLRHHRSGITPETETRFRTLFGKPRGVSAALTEVRRFWAKARMAVRQRPVIVREADDPVQGGFRINRLYR